jgi:tetratricopeptide (TPR) repeat protein
VSNRRWPRIVAIALAGQLSGVGVARGNSESAAFRARGHQFGYNLDYEEAFAAFRQAIAADPNDPAAYRVFAALTWLHLLFERGAVMVDDYLGQVKSNLSRKPPPSDLDALFHDYAQRSLALSEKQLRNDPANVDAHYQIGATVSFLASYTASVEGGVLSGFRASRRAYQEHSRVLELDPRRKDAGVVVGTYQYAVSIMPLPTRVLAYVAGFGGGRERGIRLVEEAAIYRSDVQTDAEFALIVLYSREGRYDDALRVIGGLQRQYPRNRLLWLEAGSTALRAGRSAEANAALEEGLARLDADRRPRAFGEEARWRYYHGAALVALRRGVAANDELRAALAREAPAWVHGRVHNELGKLADLAGDRARASLEYQMASRYCRSDNDAVCSEEATRLMKTAYR